MTKLRFREGKQRINVQEPVQGRGGIQTQVWAQIFFPFKHTASGVGKNKVRPLGHSVWDLSNTERIIVAIS